MYKIKSLISTNLKKKKTLKRVVGSMLFDYIVDNDIACSDSVLDSIDDFKSLEKQPQKVIDFFKDLSKDVLSDEVITHRKQLTDYLKEVCKREHVSFSLTPRIIIGVARVEGISPQFNCFKRDIELWEEKDFELCIRETTRLFEVVPPTGDTTPPKPTS